MNFCINTDSARYKLILTTSPEDLKLKADKIKFSYLDASANTKLVIKTIF